jgi:transcriptional regulator with XRE-family HTH domain
MKENIKKLMDGVQEGPIETGQTYGMGLYEILDRYLEKRNNILTILRIYTKKSLSEVSKELDISESELKEIENSNERVPFQLVPKIAKIYKVDLKMLLTILGHTKINEQKVESSSYELGLAAQYSGPEIMSQEKIDLEKLFKKIIENVKNKK